MSGDSLVVSNFHQDSFFDIGDRMRIVVMSDCVIVKYHSLILKYRNGLLDIRNYFHVNSWLLSKLGNLLILLALFTLDDWSTISQQTDPNFDMFLLRDLINHFELFLDGFITGEIAINTVLAELRSQARIEDVNEEQ